MSATRDPVGGVELGVAEASGASTIDDVMTEFVERVAAMGGNYARVDGLHPGRRGIIVLRNEFEHRGALPDGGLALLAGRIIWADQTSLNGVLLGATGRFPPEPANYFNITRCYPLPAGALRPSGSNTLLIRIYVDGEGGLCDVPLLGSAASWTRFSRSSAR